VENLEPYIERKLYTVNTGHATAAYHGFVAGAPTLAAALAIPAIFDEVTAVLQETQELLVAKHGFPPEVQRAYLEQNLKRFVNPALSDSVARVARQPLRKLSRTERFIGPAAQLAERGIPPVALLRAIAAVLQYDEPSDEQSVELNHLLDTFTAEEFVANVTGIEPGHPLYAGLIEVVSVALKNRDSL
jgi:mannitol-1-phosphate 5-dehydrogenase